MWKLAQILLWCFVALIVFGRLSTGKPLMVEHPFAFERSPRGAADEGWAGK